MSDPIVLEIGMVVTTKHARRMVIADAHDEWGRYVMLAGDTVFHKSHEGMEISKVERVDGTVLWQKISKVEAADGTVLWEKT